jgi:hypothetical protein
MSTMTMTTTTITAAVDRQAWTDGAYVAWGRVAAVRAAIVQHLHDGDTAGAIALLPAEQWAVGEWRRAVAGGL